MKKRFVIYILLVLIPSSGIFGQKSGKKISISGKVVDGTYTGVANAVILIDGEKTGYLTNENGTYKIKVSPEIKKIGIFTSTNGIIEQSIDGRSKIDFRFEGTVPVQKTDEIDPMDEAIDTGFGKVKKKEVTGSISKIDGTNPKYASYQSVYDMIRGEVPGVVVNGTSIMIRGTTSATLNTEPLFVVDGMPVTTIDNIQPSMVKSIQILKGSAASIYGLRGSNGVIVINTLGGNSKK